MSSEEWKRLRATKRTRFAPSPTGDLHLGGVLCALASRDLAAEAAGGAFVVRMEDLDPPRVVAGAAERILDDLAWLGLPGDEGPRAGGPTGPYVQSARFSFYEEALGELVRAGRTYACDCSRAEIVRVASAPHEGEDVIYPGTCKDKDPLREMRRPPATRFRGGAESDDFVLRRADGVFSYQLAVSADDLAMAIAVVIRGEDLRSSTPRQIALMKALGAKDDEVPSYVHLPLVRDASGARLSKRTAGGRVRALKDGGLSAKEILAALAPAKDGTPFVVPREWERFGV